MPAPSNRSIRSAAALLALAAALASAKGPADTKNTGIIDIQTHTPAKAYIGQQVIRVIPTTQAQLDAALDLAEGIWSERIGIGPIELQVNTSSLDAYRKIGLNPVILIDDLQARADLDWQRIVETHRLELARPVINQRGTVHDESWFTNFKQVNQIHTYINNLAAARPTIATISSIGTSIEGRDIPAITITGPDAPGNLAADRPAIIWNGCQHAREWVSPMTVTYLASRLVDEYGTNPQVTDILNTARIIVVPVVNPDGYAYSWSNERFWRKNTRGGFGVDLNRNWGYEWGGEGSSGSTSSEVYRGTGPFSEPETNAMRNLSIALGTDLVAHIDYHSYSQLVLWPFGYDFGVITPEPDRTLFDTLANDVSDEIFSVHGMNYTPMQSVDLYPAAGDSSDWYYGDLDAVSFTIELRPTGAPGFDLPPSEILPTAHESWAGALLFAQRTTQLLSFAGAQPTIIDPDTPVAVSVTISDAAGTLDASTPTLYASVAGAPETSVPMTNMGSGVFSANLPVAACNDTVNYRYTAQTTTGQTRTFPASGTFDAIAQQTTVFFEDNMETNTGWIVGAPGDTASTGIWERANPQGTAAQPENDNTVSGTRCWITGASAGATVGANDIDGGATTLTSPTFDATAGTGEPVIEYARWYSNNAGASPNADQMDIFISNDNGTSWSLLETVTENANAWVEKQFMVSDFVTPSSEMRVRFVASDMGSGSIVEAGVDDFRISITGCPPANIADINGDGILDIADVFAFLSAYNASDLSVDFTNDGILDIADVFAFLNAYNAG